LRIVGKKHDLISIVLEDRRESDLPKLGLVKLSDAETGEERWIDTSNSKVRSKMILDRKTKTAKRKSLFISNRIDAINISTGENYIQPLVQFFKMRERRW
jgi:hypothetical protein